MEKKTYYLFSDIAVVVLKSMADKQNSVLISVDLNQSKAIKKKKMTH